MHTKDVRQHKLEVHKIPVSGPNSEPVPIRIGPACTT